MIIQARSICRRAERSVVATRVPDDEQEAWAGVRAGLGVGEAGGAGVYLNRLSDFLFVAARHRCFFSFLCVAGCLVCLCVLVSVSLCGMHPPLKWGVVFSPHFHPVSFILPFFYHLLPFFLMQRDGARAARDRLPEGA
jgi:hypothetical protein